MIQGTDRFKNMNDYNYHGLKLNFVKLPRTYAHLKITETCVNVLSILHVTFIPLVVTCRKMRIINLSVMFFVDYAVLSFLKFYLKICNQASGRSFLVMGLWAVGLGEKKSVSLSLVLGSSHVVVRIVPQ